MRVTRLEITNLRAIPHATFHFQPGFNLLLGANGIGKTTVLDALAACLAGAAAQHQRRNNGALGALTDGDIHHAADTMTLACRFRADDTEYTYHIHRDRHADTHGAFQDAPPTTVATGLLSRTDRGESLSDHAHWLQSPPPAAAPAIARVLAIMLPGYAGLRASADEPPRLLIERCDSADPITLDGRQLSDGERGLLDLTLALTRRLLEANPDLPSPTEQGEAVVLIDELELHLHPRRQRRLVHDLGTAFPRCQFIATTHSPQIVGEVEGDRIQIIHPECVYSPSYAYGTDSSRILAEIMDTPPRNSKVGELLSKISREMSQEDYDAARKLIQDLAAIVGENDPEVVRAISHLEFMEDD